MVDATHPDVVLAQINPDSHKHELIEFDDVALSKNEQSISHWFVFWFHRKPKVHCCAVTAVKSIVTMMQSFTFISKIKIINVWTPNHHL